MRSSRITTAQAGALMGKGALFVREGMRRGELDLGTAMQLPGSSKWNFHISPRKLAEYLGITQEELQRALQEI